MCVAGLHRAPAGAGAAHRGVLQRGRVARALPGGRGAVQRAKDRTRRRAAALPAGVRRAGAPGR